MNMTKKKIAFLSISVAFLMTLLGGALFGQASSKTSIYRPLSIFTEVFDLVRSNYVEAVTSDQLLDGAFSGVTDAIDEFSYYVPPAQMATYKTFTDTDDNGTGLVVSRRFGYAYVISSVPGSPAAKAGVERGDFIDKIDGKSTTKMAVWQMKNALAASHPVELSVLHGGQTKREPFKLDHANFHPVNVTTKQFGNVAVITIPYFDKGTEGQFRAALDTLHKAGTRKLIVDVRGNAAGNIDEAIASADDLLTSGLITSLEGRKVEMKKWQADRNTAYDGDVEVLTDASTAGGGEIFAAAIHGNSRGKTVGVTTYGKSIVQKFITLPSGGGVYMTVAHYTTPDLKPIKDGGVKPDVLVDLSSQAIREPNDKSAPAQPREDLIMEKALSLYGENMTVTPKKAA